ncbi:MAG: VOC family protein [Chloroflexota bacterium]
MRFNHVTILVTDFEHSKAFYRTLGLIQIVDSPPRYARFRFPDGDATFSIEVVPGVTPATASTEIFFECDDVDATAAEAKSRGLALTQEPTDMHYLWREAHLRDPDGYDIRLYSDKTNARLEPPWKIKEDAAN